MSLANFLRGSRQLHIFGTLHWGGPGASLLPPGNGFGTLLTKCKSRRHAVSKLRSHRKRLSQEQREKNEKIQWKRFGCMCCSSTPNTRRVSTRKYDKKKEGNISPRIAPVFFDGLKFFPISSTKPSVGYYSSTLAPTNAWLVCAKMV